MNLINTIFASIATIAQAAAQAIAPTATATKTATTKTTTTVPAPKAPRQAGATETMQAWGERNKTQTGRYPTARGGYTLDLAKAWASWQG